MNSSELYNGTDFIAVFLSSDNLEPKEQLKKGISAIDLGNCTKIIKEHYNISEDENLIIVNMESKNNKDNIGNDDSSFDIGKNNQIEIYDFSGRKLDLSVCQEGIRIMKYIKDVEKLDIQSAFNLANIGVDVFNASDDYFNDICHNYENSDGKDIIIKDRRNDIYQNVTFCQKGCKYNGIDYDLVTANCICDSSFLQNNLEHNNTKEENNKEEKLNFRELKESILLNLFNFNINVLYCYNLVFNLKLLKRNIGFFCMIFLFFLQIIFFFIYLVKKLRPLKHYMLIFRKTNFSKTIKAFPPLKSKVKKQSFKNYINENTPNSQNKLQLENGDNKKNNNNNRNIFNLKHLFSKKAINKIKNNIFPKKNNIIFSNNFSPTINVKASVINITNNKIISDSKKGKKIKKLRKNKIYNLKSNNTKVQGKNKSLIDETLNKRAKNKLLNNMETKGNNNKNNKIVTNIDIIKLSRSDEDLLDMDYEHAIIFDKRKYLRMYWGVLEDNQIILGTFCTENYLHLFIIKLSFLICNFQISFFLNAFFYTDEYISDAYHNDGVLDFFSGLPKSIYSFFATLVITNLLRMLSNSKSELKRLIRNKRNDNNYVIFVNNKLLKLKRKLYVYFLLVFLLSLLCLYYVSAFCSVYYYSQKYWFFGFLESFGLDSLLAIFICIFISLFRYIAIKNRVKYFYIVSNIIRVIL